MKLYEITEDMKAVHALVDNEELTEEMVADTMEALDLEFKDKAEAVMKVRQGLIAESNAIEVEAERLTKLQISLNKKADWLKEYVRINMEAVGADKLDLGVFKLTLKKPIKKLGEIDESKIPDSFFSVIPEQKRLDKRALLSAAKEQAIEGVEVINGARALLIK